MSLVTLDAPLVSFPLDDTEPWHSLRAEAERNLKRRSVLPAMLMAYTQRERIALARTDLAPEALATIEEQLILLPEIRWTVFCGEAVIPLDGGAVRHIFLRRQHTDGHWTADLRPFLYWMRGLTWLGEWRVQSGQEPRPGPLFPSPLTAQVSFTRSDAS